MFCVVPRATTPCLASAMARRHRCNAEWLQWTVSDVVFHHFLSYIPWVLQLLQQLVDRFTSTLTCEALMTSQRLRASYIGPQWSLHLDNSSYALSYASPCYWSQLGWVEPRISTTSIFEYTQGGRPFWDIAAGIANFKSIPLIKVIIISQLPPS